MDATSIILPPGTPFVLDLDRAAEMLCVSKSTVQKLVREGDFPKPRLLSANRVGYLSVEVAAWALKVHCRIGSSENECRSCPQTHPQGRAVASYPPHLDMETRMPNNNSPFQNRQPRSCRDLPF